MKSFRQFLSEGVYDPAIFKAIFLAGAPGAGKSYVVKKTTSGHGFRVINSDDLFEYLLKQNAVPLDMTSMDKETYEKSQEIRAVAKHSTEVKQSLAQEGRLGLIIDGTGKNYEKIAGQRAKMEELGYDTFMIFVNCSLETSLKRNAQRDRKVRDDIVKADWQDIQSNIGKFQNLFGGDKTIIVDNNDGNNQDVYNKIWKQVKKFAEQPIQNRRAKEWIKRQMAAKSGVK